MTHIFHFPSILGIESAKHGSFRPAMGIESAKMADIEMVDPFGCYFSFIQAHWSKKMQKEYVHPCCNQDFSFFRGSSLNIARRCAWPSSLGEGAFLAHLIRDAVQIWYGFEEASTVSIDLGSKSYLLNYPDHMGIVVTNTYSWIKIGFLIIKEPLTVPGPWPTLTPPPHLQRKRRCGIWGREPESSKKIGPEIEDE